MKKNRIKYFFFPKRKMHRFVRKIDINKKDPKLDALLNKPKPPPPGYKYIRTITKHRPDNQTRIYDRPRKLPRKIYYNRIHPKHKIYYNNKFTALVFISFFITCIIIVLLIYF